MILAAVLSARSTPVMTYVHNILVVANLTTASNELTATLAARTARERVAFHVIVPATPCGGGRATANERLTRLIDRLRAAGIQVDGEVANGDPMVAVTEAWDPRRYNEIIVCTLPMRMSKWLHRGLPERIGEVTGAPVTHVVCRPPRQIHTSPAPPREKSPMGPLSVLGWGGRRTELNRTPEATVGETRAAAGAERRKGRV